MGAHETKIIFKKPNEVKRMKLEKRNDTDVLVIQGIPCGDEREIISKFEKAQKWDELQEERGDA